MKTILLKPGEMIAVMELLMQPGVLLCPDRTSSYCISADGSPFRFNSIKSQKKQIYTASQKINDAGIMIETGKSAGEHAHCVIQGPRSLGVLWPNPWVYRARSTATSRT